jgi:pyruvate formate lyase activating enzyme
MSLPNVDLVLYDLKHMDAQEHKKLTGASNQLILENLKRLSTAGVAIEIRIPIIPSLNDSPEHIDAAGGFIAALENREIAVRLLSYNSLAGSKYSSIGRMNTLPLVDSPSQQQLRALAERLRNAVVQKQPSPTTGDVRIYYQSTGEINH